MRKALSKIIILAVTLALSAAHVRASQSDSLPRENGSERFIIDKIVAKGEAWQRKRFGFDLPANEGGKVYTYEIIDKNKIYLLAAYSYKGIKTLGIRVRTTNCPLWKMRSQGNIEKWKAANGNIKFLTLETIVGHQGVNIYELLAREDGRGFHEDSAPSEISVYRYYKSRDGIKIINDGRRQGASEGEIARMERYYRQMCDIIAFNLEMIEALGTETNE